MNLAVAIAKNAQPAWAATTVVKRGEILRQIAILMRERRAQIADLVAQETGKSRRDALGETDAAIEMGFFLAGEGRRFYGQTTTSAVPNKSAMIMRQPLGVAGLIIAANTPIANVAWKAFPALLCGNAAILKAADICDREPLRVARFLSDKHYEPRYQLAAAWFKLGEPEKVRAEYRKLKTFDPKIAAHVRTDFGVPKDPDEVD